MSREKPAKEILEKFVRHFAERNEDGEYWGHDTNLGRCAEAFEEALSALSDMVPKAEHERVLEWSEKIINVIQRHREAWGVYLPVHEIGCDYCAAWKAYEALRGAK